MKKIFLITIIALGGIACNTGELKTQSGQNGLRSDGYYESHHGKVIYLARFFTDGNVALVGGMEDGYAQMVTYLSSKGPSMNDNVHYVPFDLHANDSLFFHTKSLKGEIEYFAFSGADDTLRVLKHSHINGKQMVLAYGFIPDP